MRENEEQTYTCSECGAVVNEENLHTFDEHVLCDECLERLTVTCDNCGRRIWRTDAACDRYTTLCSHCYEYHYTSCEHCGRLIECDSANYDEDDDFPYCDECYREIQESAIKPYNYKPEPIFYGSGALFYGVELEVDKGGERSDYA